MEAVIRFERIGSAVKLGVWFPKAGYLNLPLIPSIRLHTEMRRLRHLWKRKSRRRDSSCFVGPVNAETGKVKRHLKRTGNPMTRELPSGALILIGCFKNG